MADPPALPAPSMLEHAKRNTRRIDHLLLSLAIERRVNDAFVKHGDLWRLDALRSEIMRGINEEIRAMPDD